MCGNGVLDHGEFCDGSPGCVQCVPPRNYMCDWEFRAVSNSVDSGYSIDKTNLIPTMFPKTCAWQRQGFLWDAERHAASYDPNTTIPPTGMYTSETCSSFPTPPLLEMKDCDLQAKDVCKEDSFCDATMICVSAYNSFTCACDETQIPLGYENKACSSNGIRFQVVFEDHRSFVESATVQKLSTLILLEMSERGILLPNADTSLARTSSVVDFAQFGRRRWSLYVDVALEWIISDTSPITEIANSSCSQLNFSYVRVAQTDISESISDVKSVGLEIVEKKWSDTPANGLGWVIRLRIPASASSKKILYLSKKSPSGDLQGMIDSERPCRFTGSGDADGSCCLEKMSDMFHLPQSLQPFWDCSLPGADIPPVSAEGEFGGTSNESTRASLVSRDDGYDVEVFLSYHDAETKMASKTVSQGAFQFDFFVGVADVHFFDGHMAVTYTQQSLASLVTSAYTVISESSVTRTLSQNIDIQIVRVHRDSPAQFHDFARVSMTILDDDVEFVADGVIPPTSATFRVGYTASVGGAEYMCPYSASADFRSFQEEHTCVFQEPVCSDLASNSGKHLVFVFPLGTGAVQTVLETYDLDHTAMIQKLYLDFFVNVLNTGNAKRSMERVQTSSQIYRHNLNVQCTSVQTTVKLQDLVTVDMIGGLIQRKEDLNTSVSFFEDITNPVSNEICDEINEDSICMNKPELGLGSMTYMILGDDRVFGASDKGQYELKLSGMFSIYFLSELKRIAVRNLLRRNEAFITPPGSRLEDSAFLIPSEKLLTLCPLHVVRNSYGCISRWEVEDTVFDFVTSSITSLSIPRQMNTSGVIYNETDVNLDNWIKTGSLGSSEFMQDVIRTHSGVVIDRFQTNDRYRKAFVQSNQLPWTQSALRAINVTSNIDVVQDTFSFMLITMHSTVHQHGESVYAKVTRSTSMPVQCDFWTAHPYLQNTFIDTYMFILGLNRKLISIAQGTVVDVAHGCEFSVDIELPYQNQARALAQGAKMANEFNNPLSILSKRVSSTLRDSFEQLEYRLGLDFGPFENAEFQGSQPAQMVPYPSAQSMLRRHHQGSRVLQSSGPVDDVNLTSLSRNDSLFASELSSRRYKGVNSADKMASLIEEQITSDGDGDKIENGTSRLAIVEIMVPKRIACLENESLALEEMRDIMERALKLSTAASVAAITPTSFVVLDNVDCEPTGPARRLLQDFITAKTEMVFTPEKNKKSSVTIDPTVYLRKLPGGVKMLRVQQAVTLNPNAVGVKSSWIGDMPPDTAGLPFYYSTTETFPGPTELLRILSLSTVCVLVASIMSMIATAYAVLAHHRSTDHKPALMGPAVYLPDYSPNYQALPQQFQPQQTGFASPYHFDYAPNHPHAAQPYVQPLSEGSRRYDPMFAPHPEHGRRPFLTGFGI